MINDHQKIHGKQDAVEYYTPEFVMSRVRAVMGGIDYDPASCAAANQIVKATSYTSDPGYSPAGIAVDGLPCRYPRLGGLDTEWRDRVWLNHPFGRDERACPHSGNCTKAQCVKRGYHLRNDKPGSMAWIEKLVTSYTQGTTKAAATITFANTDAGWFRLLLPFPQVYLYKRVNFLVPDGNGGLVATRGVSKGAVLTFFGVDPWQIKREFSDIGQLKVAYL